MRGDISITPMKIYPNNEMNQMLKNGTARVISYKALPYRYLTIGKDTPAASHAGSRRDESHGSGAAVTASEDAHVSPVPDEPATPPAAVIAPEQKASPVAAAAPEPEPTAAPAAVIPAPEPETLPVSVTASEPIIPRAAAAVPELEASQAAEAAAAETAVPAAEPADTPEAHVPPEIPDAPPETLQQQAVVPETAPEPEKTIETPNAAPDVALDAAPEPAQLAEFAPESSPPAEEQTPIPRPGITARILQPESAPGGLIAALQYESDASGLVFGTAPGYVSATPAIGTVLSAADVQQEEGPSYPPYINFTAFNRLGLTVKNLTNLLDSDEDFELNIIDCNSRDNSWDYIQSLNDSRIKSRIRFSMNCGPIYAANFGLSRRKPNQYYIVMDSDTYIKTKNWIARFMEVFDAFPEVGLLGLMRDNPYPRYLPPIIPRVSGGISYLELKNADITATMDFVPGHLQCMRPGLIREVGYWNEENGFGDAELSPRIVHYTNYKAGFITTIDIDMTQKITCDACMGRDFCTLSRSICDCFEFSKIHNKNESFVTKNTWKFVRTFEELKEGVRTAYCASIHDPEAVRTHGYNAEWAYDNFNHYILNAN